jgi:RNA polymerase sigma-70 factor (ECF subfamily)
VLKTTSTAVAPPCSSGSRGLAIGIVQLVATAALTEVNDADLARALIGGHPDAPRAIWIRFAPLVRRLVRRSLGPDQGVEDLVQDVFASLFEKPQRLREPAAFRSFLMSITLNHARYELRRRRVRRWVGLSQSSELPDIRVVESNPEAREALVRFYRILDGLRTRDRLAYVLRYVEGMEVADVARAMNTSVPTARRCFARAHERVSLLASRDPFLTEYLTEAPGGQKR